MNLLERYGKREGDAPSLHPMIAVIGKREIKSPIENVIAPHKQPNPQMIYVEQGELDWWVDGQFYHLTKGDLLLIKANEVQTSLKGCFQPGNHFFMQICLEPKYAKDTFSFDEYNYVKNLIQNYKARFVSLAPHARDYFHNLLQAHHDRDEFSSIYAKSQFFEILNQMDLAQKSHQKKKMDTRCEVTSMLLKVDQYLEENINHLITVQELADLFELSEVHFRRKFTQACGVAPLKYINQKKCNEARRLLFETNMSVTDIAFHLAYSSSQHLSSTFAKFFSLSPREYRKELKIAYEQMPLASDAEVSNRITSKFN